MNGFGGAGAFSDGKLTCRSKDPLLRKVLEELVQYGADPDILVDAYPHIGTDAFVEIIENMRQAMIKMGATFHFHAKLEDMIVQDDRLKALIVNGEEVACQACILAIGHSASDTIHALYERGLHLENKPFPIGVRIEHTQEFINQAMLGDFKDDPRLIPARYTLTTMTSNKKGVYTFCMCPGGSVIPAASEEGGIVTNGMSDYARAGDNADSALLVQLSAADYGEKLFDGMEFQRRLERAAYGITGSYRAPVQLFGDFMKDRVSVGFGSVRPTYPIGTVFAPLGEILPSAVTRTIKAAVSDMGRRLRGFDSADALMTGVETRFSSPVRILRDGSGQSVSVRGLYPCGEGSGYSGGITSSAADGLRIADLIFADLSL